MLWERSFELLASDEFHEGGRSESVHESTLIVGDETRIGGVWTEIELENGEYAAPKVTKEMRNIV